MVVDLKARAVMVAAMANLGAQVAWAAKADLLPQHGAPPLPPTLICRIRSGGAGEEEPRSSGVHMEAGSRAGEGRSGHGRSGGVASQIR